MNPNMALDVIKAAPLAEAAKAVLSKVPTESITPEVIQTTVKWTAGAAAAAVGVAVIGDTANKAIEAHAEVAAMKYGYDRTIDESGKKLTKKG